MAPGAIEQVKQAVLFPVQLSAKLQSTEIVDKHALLDAAIARFTEQNPRSKQLHEHATNTLPGGNSRTQLHTSPFPIFMKSGKGYQVTSEDGETYTDLVGELTAGLYGHSHPVIRSAVVHVLDEVGINLGATISQEAVHASAICERFDLERVRFTNSGTEANLHALAVARAFTGKSKAVVFSGGYHGGVLTFAGGKPAANNVDQDKWIVARYNDIDSARSAIKQDGVAAVLLEGMQGGPGAIPAKTEFLKAIEDTAKEAGVVFILDEVMTSRLAPGGLASIHHIKPDLKSFGKWLGGGLAFGAFGGRADIMAIYDPRELPAGSPETQKAPLAHHGTFNNNSLAMHAGHAGLTKIYPPDVCTEFNEVGTRLRERLIKIVEGTKMCFTGVGNVMASHFTVDGLHDIEREVEEDQTLKSLFWFEMLENKFWITKRGIIALVLGTPQSELDRFVECVEKFLERNRAVVRL